MLIPRSKKPVRFEVAGLAPLPDSMEEWERALIEPMLARLFDAAKPPITDTNEVCDGEAN